ncbi:MAG: mechanosensitive ion channel [Nanohaloarchaea archaeon]|nr:mechanosensitive ion channel [Candidatus Nanohaloarchaea archaeon]
MAQLLASLLDFGMGQNPLVRTGVALLILVLGHLGVKLVNILGKKYWANRSQELTKREVENRYEILEYLSYILDAGVLLLALLYINTGLSANVLSSLASYVPRVISAIMVAVLGFIAINLSTRLGRELLKNLGTESYMNELGLSGGSIDLLGGLLKGFLYLLLMQVALAEFGIGSTFVDELVTASSWAVAFLVAGLVFYGFKDLFENYAAGIYLKNTRNVRPGEEAEIEDEIAEVQKVSLFSTSLNTMDGRTIVVPNQKMMDSKMAFKRTQSDLETLEDIKEYFVAEKPETSGAASIVMALEIFGYRSTQEEIDEKLEESSPEEIYETVRQVTESEVKTAFIEKEKITDLSAELKTWFNDGGLASTEIEKSEIFPESDGKQFVLCVGVENREVLVVDPVKNGGVYYVEREKLQDAIVDDSGYYVFAPQGTTAFWRIKNDLIYSDRNYYDELSKTLESRLTKIMRQGRLMQESMPESVSSYMEKWRKNGDVTRLWSPNED